MKTGVNIQTISLPASSHSNNKSFPPGSKKQTPVETGAVVLATEHLLFTV
jgi:hypothetical protein